MAHTGSNSIPAPSPKALVAGILAALIFGAAWGLQQHARPVPPTADLYTHLSVARHLVRGEGYLSDIAYPLSFAYPFARRLPQPLVHRMPGFGTLMVLPYLASGCNPLRTIDMVRLLQILLVMVMMGIGCRELWRRGAWTGIAFWMILMGTSPLLNFAVAWGQDEILAGLMLLVIWLHLRRTTQPHPFFIGAVTGLLAMVRLELFWVPVVWWLVLARTPKDTNQRRLRMDPAFWLMFAAATAVLIPWSLRTLSLTGQPFFTLQGVAEHVKDTRTFPGYSVYQGLDPQPLLHTLITDPLPVARKTVRGLRFYLENLPRFMAWPWLLVLVSAPLAMMIRKLLHRPAGKHPPRELALATATTLILGCFYSPFDHSLRHLLPVLPLLTWELAAFAVGPFSVTSPRDAFSKAAVLSAAAVIAALVFPCHLPGWESAAADAARRQPEISQAASTFKNAPADVFFVDDSAVPWLADRPGVWTPADAATRTEITDMLQSRK